MSRSRPSTPPLPTASVPLRKVNSSPARGFETVMTTLPSMSAAKAAKLHSLTLAPTTSPTDGSPSPTDRPLNRFERRKTPAHCVLDQYGFIANMDSHGRVIRNANTTTTTTNTNTNTNTPPLSRRAASQLEKQEQFWAATIPKLHTARTQRTLKRKLRQGIPTLEQRAQVWKDVGRVPDYLRDHPGVYAKLVRQVVSPRQCLANGAAAMNGNGNGKHKHTSSNGATTNSNNDDDNNYSDDDPKSFRNIQETIERDIHRTFPRHSMFYEPDPHEAAMVNGNNANHGVPEHSADDMDNASTTILEQKSATNGLCGSAPTDITNMIRQLELKQQKQQQEQSEPPSPAYAPGDPLPPEQVLQERGGQASLRRVLKAYSSYDREIGYCQGMNFIAGMFLTLTENEEESFWLLVAVMNDQPCRMRGLFGEGMKETHQVLHVAEKLIQQFLPKLAAHFENEQMHITMFCTQWLLTIYTSSFPFELVMRVWDCFLREGWKIVYRVMLALLQKVQSELLQLGFEDILATLRDLPERVKDMAIVEASLKIPLRTAHIRKYEREWQRQNS